MKFLQELFHRNQAWSKKVKSENPDFFDHLAKMQTPQYFWIGCSDSRVPESQIVSSSPGEFFVHRNVANVVCHTDINFFSALQYAVQVLKVPHIIVCGHYGCGGVAAASGSDQLGLIDNWLRNIKDVYNNHSEELDRLEGQERINRLCELNVMAQVDNVCRTSFVQDAWANGHKIAVHGWIYSLEDGLLKDLDVTVDNPEHLHEVYRFDT